MIDKNVMQMIAFGETSDIYDDIDRAIDFALLDTLFSMYEGKGEVRHPSVTIYVPSHGHEWIIAKIVERKFSATSKVFETEEELFAERGAFLQGADEDSYPITQITISWPLFNSDLH